MSGAIAELKQGDILWTPGPAAVNDGNLARYWKWAEERFGRVFRDYAELWEWSVQDSEAFWLSLVEYFQVQLHAPAESVLQKGALPRGKWFSGATLNYAEHALRETDENSPAILFLGEPEPDGSIPREEISRAELLRRVAVVAAELRRIGVGRGDRVAGYFCNSPEAVIAFLATASVGAIWSNCSAELNPKSVLERFSQIEPKALFAVDGYRYGGKYHDRRAAVEEIRKGLPTLLQVILVENTGAASAPRSFASPDAPPVYWRDLFLSGEPPALNFEPVPFDHPLWILYSSGTTGLPKAIVHGHGGMLLEHLKVLSFHLDLRAGDRFFWFTSSGWMMWNLLISGLLLPGVTVVLYDGSPKYPDFMALWALADANHFTYFGTSAPFLTAGMKEALDPSARFSFKRLRSLGSTGAPLSPEGFQWVYQRVKSDLHLGSVSGGTDVCSAFVLGQPMLPVRAGELQCLALGVKIEAWDDAGGRLFGQVGELVISAPFPAMPVCFWNDADGRKLRASYYEKFPGVWAHGDWIEIGEPALRCVIHGRSDSTLNRGGVRMGTAEFYSVVERIPAIAESLVIDTSSRDCEGRLLLFVALRDGAPLDAPLRDEIRRRLREEVSPRHLPDAIHAVPEIPKTLNGKRLEVPVKRILAGLPVEKAVSREAMANPQSLNWFLDFAQTLNTVSA